MFRERLDALDLTACVIAVWFDWVAMGVSVTVSICVDLQNPVLAALCSMAYSRSGLTADVLPATVVDSVQSCLRSMCGRLTRPFDHSVRFGSLHVFSYGFIFNDCPQTFVTAITACLVKRKGERLSNADICGGYVFPPAEAALVSSSSDKESLSSSRFHTIVRAPSYSFILFRVVIVALFWRTGGQQ
jgi:hypothetical protein